MVNATIFEGAYASPGQYRKELEGVDSDDDDSLNMSLVAAARYLDYRLNRHMGFNQTPAPVTLRFKPARDSSELLIYDIPLAAGVAVVVDGAAVTDYELGPPNAPYMPEAKPFDRLFRTGSGCALWRSSAWVYITATWGWPKVPMAITQANIWLASILRLEGKRATRETNLDSNTVLGTSSAAQKIIGELMDAYWTARE